jgi:citrate lyase subunit beta / citryl-CoA lyase
MHPRTYLFVPGNRPDRFDKALQSGADAVIVDLEDAVAPIAKDAARACVCDWLRAASVADLHRVLVRINDARSAWFEEDAALLREFGLVNAMLPKAESAQGIARLRQLAGESLRVLALVETARGVRDVDALAEAPGVSRLAFGTIDYALDLDLSGEEAGFTYAASRIAIASRAAGLPSPVAGITPDIRDLSQLRADLKVERAHGYTAKLCIHPGQVSAIHEAMRPPGRQVEWAQRVVAASDSAEGAVVQVDGEMVDKPVLERARAILLRAA